MILKVTYGYNTEQFKKDPLLGMMNEAMEHFSYAVAPGAFLVDMIPICESLLLQLFGAASCCLHVIEDFWLKL